MTYTAEPHRGSNARKTGNKSISGGSRAMEEANEKWAGERETRHPAEAWFFSFPSVASSKAGRSEYDNFFRGERAPPKEAFPCGNPHRGLRLAFRAGPLP